MGLLMGGILIFLDMNLEISFIQGERTPTKNDSKGAKDVFIGTDSVDIVIQEEIKVERTNLDNTSDLSHCSKYSHVSGGPLAHKNIDFFLDEGTTYSTKKTPLK